VQKRLSRNCLLAALLPLCVAIFVAGYQLRARPIWTPDGYAYAVRMLTYSGLPFNVARERAQRFYAGLPVAKVPQYASLFRGKGLPTYYRLFAPRVLYPALAATLWPARGFAALLDVSLLAYVIAALAMYLLLLQFGQPLMAMIGATAFCLTPQIRTLGASALTDMLAVMLWICVLFVMCRAVVQPRPGWLAAGVLLIFALSFTRPLSYMPFLAACGLALAARKNDAASLRTAMLFGGTAIVAAIAVTIAGVAARAQVPYPPLPVWLRTIAHITLYWLKLEVDQVIPLFAFAALVWRRNHPCAPLILGALLSAPLTIVINPIVWDLERTVLDPLLPLILCGAVLGIDSLWLAFRQRSLPLEQY